MKVVLIPAYNPSIVLINLINNLVELGFEKVIVVNDGSELEYESVFEQLKQISECVILTHSVNQGKGRALKTGINYFNVHLTDSIGLVTADADGQHSAEDILKVASYLEQNPDRFVLGVRSFSKEIPLRSFLGNVLTKYIFALLVGKKVNDTQSGLRGIPKIIIPQLLQLEGERYEYETNMLIAAAKMSDIYELDINTIYIENNQSSHFNPLIDSMKIYFLLIRFASSSAVTSFIDFTVFTLLINLTSTLLLSIFSARFIASIINFALNKNLVFQEGKTLDFKTIIKYYMLLIVLGTCSYYSIRYFNVSLGYNILVSKVVTELMLFLLSFKVQKELVFNNRRNKLRTKDAIKCQ